VSEQSTLIQFRMKLPLSARTRCIQVFWSASSVPLLASVCASR